jgi:hypothetical protein
MKSPYLGNRSCSSPIYSRILHIDLPSSFVCSQIWLNLEPCALNAEFQTFHTEILLKFPYFGGDTIERAERIGGERDGDFTDNLLGVL